MQRRRPAPVQGRLRLLARHQRRRWRIRTRATSRCSGTQTLHERRAGVGYGPRPLRLLHDRRHRHDRRDGRQHPEPVRAGQLADRVAADTEPRRPHRERGHSRRSVPTSRRSAFTSAGARSWLRASASPTTSSATTGSKISGSYGRYYDWTKYELARGTFGGDVWTTRYRSLDDPDPSKLSRAALTGTKSLGQPA